MKDYLIQLNLKKILLISFEFVLFVGD